LESSSTTQDKEDDVEVICVVETGTHAPRRARVPASSKEFNVLAWCEAQGLGRLPPVEAIAKIRGKHAELLASGHWERRSKGVTVQAEAASVAGGKPIRVFQVDCIPRMELKVYASVRRFFVDLVASVLYASLSISMEQRFVVFARMLDSIAHEREMWSEVRLERRKGVARIFFPVF
jgi:hypothetical protein